MKRSSINEGMRCLLVALTFAFGFARCSKPIYNEILEQPCIIDKNNSFYGIDINKPTMMQVRRTLGKGVKSKIIHKRGTRMNILFRNWDVVLDYPRYGIKIISYQFSPLTLRKQMHIFILYDSCKCETVEGIRIGSTYHEVDSLIGPCDLFWTKSKELGFDAMFCSDRNMTLYGSLFSDTSTFRVQRMRIW